MPFHIRTTQQPTLGVAITQTIGGIATAAINTFGDRSTDRTVIRRTALTAGGTQISTGMLFLIGGAVLLFVLLR